MNMTDHDGSNWDQYNLPCPKCGGSDPVAKNKDGSAHCFSCDAHFSDYEKAGGVVKENDSNSKQQYTKATHNILSCCMLVYRRHYT